MKKIKWLLVATQCLASLSLSAASLFDTLGTPTIGTKPVMDGAAQSFRTGSQSYFFNYAQLNFRHNPGGANSAYIFLCNNSSGQPGSVIQQLDGPSVVTYDGVYTYTGNAQLVPDTPYWILAQAGGMTYNWCVTTETIPVPESIEALFRNGPVWQSIAGTFQMKIDVAVVPEPNSLLLLGFGLSGMACLWRRRS